MPKTNMQTPPADRSPSPPAKRPRAALNFSIESIMQPSECKTFTNHNSALSSSGSSSGLSRISSQNSPLISLAGRSHEKHHQQPLDQVECVLENKTMWDKFHSLNTEMIITKTGRRMFPVLKIQFLNLDPTARYAVSMDIVPVDNKRYRYAYHKSCWQVAGKADPSAEPRLYPHPDSPFNGDLLGRQTISFEKVKLTNNEMDKSGHLILNSMHKYQPRIHLILLKSQQAPNSQRNQQTQLDIEAYKTFTFPETVFTAVTAYQNQLITKMKIEKNPFAKGFRDSSRLSDLDRNDPFESFMSLGPVAAAACAAGTFSGSPGSLETAAASLQPGCSHMDQAYSQLLAAASNSPWSSVPNAATQLWLAAFSACLRGSNE